MKLAPRLRSHGDFVMAAKTYFFVITSGAGLMSLGVNARLVLPVTLLFSILLPSLLYWLRLRSWPAVAQRQDSFHKWMPWRGELAAILSILCAVTITVLESPFSRTTLVGPIEQEEPYAAKILLRAHDEVSKGEWNKARDDYLAYLVMVPHDSSAISDLGTCYRKLGDPKEALAAFDRALAIDPSNWEALYNKIVVLAVDLGRQREAKELLGQLRRLSPDSGYAARLNVELSDHGIV